jgi:hypothetical protein
MYLKYIIITFFILNSNLYCFSPIIEFNISYSDMNMSSSNNLSQYVIPSTFLSRAELEQKKLIPFDFQLYLLYPISMSEIGITLNYISNISKVTYTDDFINSNYNQYMYGLGVGGVLNLNIFNKYGIKGYIHLEAGKIFSFLDIDESIKRPDTSISNSYYYKTDGYYFKPGFKICYNFIDNLDIGTEVSYFNDFRPTFNGLYNQKTGEQISAEWQGIRTGLYISYHFKSQ